MEPKFLSMIKNCYFVPVMVLLIAFFSCSGERKIVTLITKYFRLDLNTAGMITSIEDLATGKNHLSDNLESPLLSLMDSTIIHPNALSYDLESKVLTLSYPSGSKASVKVKENDDYLRFEVLSVEPRGNITPVSYTHLTLPTTERV